ncbi:uncharacterized protein LOC8265731 [Ricinus communis]|uniref:S-adenosylmethionine-dependent methyltransferase n=1 Tax=Ricinus communis TaxID=3988 RepID=B9SQT5_RICCO|nr:uncharacterized protein LOC8265731 [Ricinus communis]EEF34026.1 conserved hypothetical protein [Ricinus communis]|eukprot:XP_002528354.1 uncharacterized protein LOC8265731 isoform X1 [Ricinus communis]
MWYRTKLSSRWNIRKFCTAARRRIDDEGDWFYSSEWWGTDSSSSSSNGHTVLRSTSNRGNGVVSVVAYPSSRPSKVDWPKAEKWFSQRYAEMHPVEEHDVFRIVGYQWRTLRFNDDTRQSTAKVMAAYHQSLPNSIFLMQQSHCLAVPYLKSMISAGFTTLASCNYDLVGAVYGNKTMRVLCIGHGGGSLPLFLASKIQGAMIHIVEIDPLVISASVQAMGFPAFSVMASPDQRALSKPSIMDEIMWRGIHERLYLYESDAENFVLNSSNLYDMIFIDAYDGDDIFPRKLWDADSPFLNALKDRLHPEHGTVVVNLHADYEAFSPHPSVSYFNQQLLPMSKHVRKVCRAYKDILTGDGNSCGEKQGSGFVFTVAVPWVCNTSMVVCRGLGMSNRFSSRDSIANAVISKSLEVENILNLPFSCFEYIKRDFTLID